MTTLRQTKKAFKIFYNEMKAHNLSAILASLCKQLDYTDAQIQAFDSDDVIEFTLDPMTHEVIQHIWNSNEAELMKTHHRKDMMIVSYSLLGQNLV